jgi:hypothetical protein
VEVTIYTEELVTTDTLTRNNAKIVAAATPTVYHEELVAVATLINSDVERRCYQPHCRGARHN